MNVLGEESKLRDINPNTAIMDPAMEPFRALPNMLTYNKALQQPHPSVNSQRSDGAGNRRSCVVGRDDPEHVHSIANTRVTTYPTMGVKSCRGEQNVCLCPMVKYHIIKSPSYVPWHPSI